MELEKKCIRCGEIKPKSEYYTHKQMKDGTLNACKSCIKISSKKREEKIKLDPKLIEKERERHRNKYHRLGYKEKHRPTNEQKHKAIKKHRNKYPEKYKAKGMSQHIEVAKGYHRHHWSYNEKHAKDVIILTIKDHYKLHRFIKYDQESFMYRTLDGEILHTKEKHINYMNKILEQAKDY